ncbi:MAG TPA: carbohydrate kinase family protein [Patescibacteria group bacterium]|nr:carbohydrate kinase family protein [Patescibacteria group bacterium]
MKNILVLGSVAYDYIMDYPQTFAEHILPDKLHELAISFTLNRLSKTFGGNGGNTAYTLSLLGQTPTLLSSVGSDDFSSYEAHMQKYGVDLQFVQKIPDEHTSTAFIMTDKNNCQITGFYEGAGAYNKNISLPNPKQYAIFTILPSTISAMMKFVREARDKIPYIYSPAQEITQLSKEELIEGIIGAEVLLVNDYEIELIIKATGMGKEALRNAVKVLVTTLGKKGSIIETKDEIIEVGIVPAETVKDPTGAGDAYIAGFAAGYSSNQLSLEVCGQIGATAATYAIEQYGTQTHNFTKDEFSKRFEATFHKPLALFS